MPDLSIEFVSEEIDFTLQQTNEISIWLRTIITEHQFKLENLTYIFCDDNYLLEINQEYLDHDTLTDIITFNNADEVGIIESDIFISIERVRENANNLKVDLRDELHRVMAHGVLHLLGYDDKTNDLKQQMRSKEDYYLSLRNF
ncbi:MAG: rRNA maturation RNase YbeY [Cytophagales bacterium CG18_big_fil_WC_8_21_14_2_50_42_9]|nr:MAG: rRNA maturation RNase YbeY [Cytophagales bacterium CG18_big_fil_WC_8_21_14_2_50_42_9]